MEIGIPETELFQTLVLCQAVFTTRFTSSDITIVKDFVMASIDLSMLLLLVQNIPQLVISFTALDHPIFPYFTCSFMVIFTMF